MKRVVVTGMGAVSPYGNGVDAMWSGLRDSRSTVQMIEHENLLDGMTSQVAAVVPDIGKIDLPRSLRRSMPLHSQYAYLACEEALAMANFDKENCASGELGVAMGSTVPSTEVLADFFKRYHQNPSIDQVKTTYFFKVMNHSCAANVARVLDIRGRLWSPSSACATSAQAIGLAYETIAMGQQEAMLCGGADEYHMLTTGVFDLMMAASSGFNDRPAATPRPFDRDRDGVVCGEGAGILLLESLESAEKRGATIIGEIVGFATLVDSGNMADPDPEGIARCMQRALASAQLDASDVDYVNAHATGTRQGDVSEGLGIHQVFGDGMAVSSLKGHLAHTMAASGALELIASIKMKESGLLIPNLNLENADEQLTKLDLLQTVQERKISTILKNNFALGGVNVSLVLR